MKKRILFLMSDTGGGHRASARAIEQAINILHPNTFDIFIDDIWRGHTPWPFNKIPNTYPWFTGPGLPLWRLMWTGSARTNAHKIVMPSLSPVFRRKAVHYLQSVQPDVVVSVHPFMNHLGVKWTRKLSPSIPFVTVVTDMVTVHPLWVCPTVTRCIVPTPIARHDAIAMGMPPVKISVCGQPVDLKFSMARLTPAEARQKLGVNPARPTILVAGGGEGFGRVFEITRAIAASAPQAQLLVVCGRNQALKQQLEATVWNIPVRIYGFVDNMPELMRAADLLVTKAGPGTLNEAFIMGLPTLISGYIPGQEEGNVTYVRQHNAGMLARSPNRIARLVSSWLQPEDTTLQSMARNAAGLARPRASLDIAAIIGNLANRPHYVSLPTPPHRPRWKLMRS